MLTNVTKNFKNDDFNNNLILDSENGNQWTLNTLSKFIERNKGNWKKYEMKLKIVVKTILVNFNEIQKKCYFPNLRSNNIIHSYGFDIMIMII